VLWALRSALFLARFAFFVFFTFKEWKRLLLADGPRQSINALTLYSFYLSKRGEGDFWDLHKYYKDYVTLGLLVSILFTVLVFIGSMLTLMAAGICYVPLLCYIRGNLKEYCCHKVDKRISEVVKRNTRERIQKEAALARKEAAGLAPSSLPQPTLPSLSVDDDDIPQKYDQYWGDHKSGYEGSLRGTPAPAYGEYPPMPMYPFKNANASYADSIHGSEHDYLANTAQPMGRGGTPAPAANQYYGEYQQQPYGEYQQQQQQPYGDYHANSGLSYEQEVPGRTPSRNQLQYGAARRSPGPDQYGGGGAAYGGGF